MTLDDWALVWNRAAMGEGGRRLKPGDRALKAALLAHSLIMNDGVHHAIESMTKREVDAACEGFATLGLDRVAEFLRATRVSMRSSDDTELERLEARVDNRYASLISTRKSLDGRLWRAFRRHRKAHPELYAPPT